MSNDPQAPFWHAIERDPSAPGPRLVFADWCAENGLPAMAEVQRWLAATGRYPAQVTERFHAGWWEWRNQWYWDWCRSGGDSDFDNRTLPAVLPEPLFAHVRGWEYSWVQGRDQARSIHGITARYYRSLRIAEERLAAAWARATRPRRWYTFWHQPWVPDWSPVALIAGGQSTEPSLGGEDRP